MKKCTKCGIEKALTDFHLNRGKSRPQCKECVNIYNHGYRRANPEKIREFGKRWRDNNREVLKAYENRRYEDNKEARKASMKRWQENNREVRNCYRRRWYEKNKEACKVSVKRWREANKGIYNSYAKRWRKARRLSDPVFKLVGLTGTRVRAALKGISKHKPTIFLLGGLEETKRHLENQFRDGMSWENYGPVWHVDHIRPCASFDLTKPDQQAICFHHSNLQPLLVKENLTKGAKYDTTLIP